MIRGAHHIGVAVKDLRDALDRYRAIGLEAEPFEEVPSQGVRVAFLRAGGVTIELLESLRPEGAIARFIERRGEGLHHLAFATSDIRGEIERLAGSGFEIVDREPHRGARGRLVAFLHPRSVHGVLVELVQEGNEKPTTPQHD